MAYEVSSFLDSLSKMSDDINMKFKPVNCCVSFSSEAFSSSSVWMKQRSVLRAALTVSLCLPFLLPPSRHMGPNPDAPNQYGCDQGSDGGAEGLVQHRARPWTEHQHHPLELCLWQHPAGKDTDWRPSISCSISSIIEHIQPSSKIFFTLPSVAMITGITVMKDVWLFLYC